jgi:excisionase family DNA binding protein
MEETLLDKAQACERLNINIWHLEHLIRYRQIPFIKIGTRKVIRFKAEDLDAWIEDKRIEAVD